MIELTDIRPTDREVELLHPGNKQPLGLIFQLRSPYSPEVKKVEREWLDFRLQRKAGEQPDSKAIDDLRTKQILAGVSGWRFKSPDSLKLWGEQPEFSESKLKKLIRSEGLEWIRDFLDKETGNRASFFEELEMDLPPTSDTM